MFKKSDDRELGNLAGQNGPRPGELVCAGEDLKDMLALLSRQFVEADQRNSVALHDMRGRLEDLGRTAETVRDQVPSQYAPTFARIEDGVQHLAERIGAVGREREVAKATAAMTQHESSPNVETPMPIAAPAASHAAAYRVAPDQSVAGDVAEPWDLASAEALAQLYETGEAKFGAAEIDPTPYPALPAVATLAPELSFVAPAAITAAEPAPHDDRAWLEERFAAIATRVEQSLTEMRPDNALLAFDGRLEQLEHRFSSALEDVATRSDVEGLRIIEAHINELAGHFEQAQGQLGRLDHIERQIGDLMHQVSDERFADLFSQIVPAALHQGPSEGDIEAVAMAVADRVASRLPSPEYQAPAFDAGSIGDLKRLVEGFVAGQRETEEHTSTMLDTMQQAMIRMLDRMDAMESAPPSYGAQQANFAVPMAAPAAAPVHSAAPQRAELSFGSEAALPAQDMPSVGTSRAAPQNKEDFRAAAIADARRAARKVSTQTTDGAAPQADASRARRGASAVEVHVAEPSVVEEKRKPRTPLMVAGVALVVAIGFLAASVGINRGGPVSERQTAQQKAPLTIENGSLETTAGELPDSTQKTATPTPSIEASGSAPRPAPAAAMPRPPVNPGQPGGKSGTVLQGLGDQQDGASEQKIVPQDASLRAPGTAPMTNAIGISVTPTNAAQNNSDLARMRQQRNMASLASQLAAVQANAPTLPASMMPDNAALTASAAADTAIAADVATPAEMPPVQIGPNSLRLAAQKGDPSAEFEVAARFAEGRGVAQDFKQANSWYSRAAQRGFAPAQYRLGTLFERGIGTKADVARAKVWYGRAAEQGHVKAMHNLAVLNSGREQSADYAMAVHWFTAAAERGLADSQYNLGVLYESGLGLPRDLKQAYHWLSLAARNGDKEAARRRDQIRMKLEEGEVVTADGVIEKWRAQATDPAVNEARAAGEIWKQRQTAGR